MGQHIMKPDAKPHGRLAAGCVAIGRQARCRREGPVLDVQTLRAQTPTTQLHSIPSAAPIMQGGLMMCLPLAAWSACCFETGALGVVVQRRDVSEDLRPHSSN